MSESGWFWFIITSAFIVWLENISIYFENRQCNECRSYRTEELNTELKCWNCGSTRERGKSKWLNW